MSEMNVLSAYAAYSKNDSLRLQSSSGAVFPLLADAILLEKGIVYGVAMSEDCKSAVYVRIDSAEDIPRLMGSKYLQAKAGGVFKQIKRDLDSGKHVLFTGTGCQVNGLRCFLGNDYDRLFCVDIVCHGVPSSRLWKSYVEYLEKKDKSKLKAVNFRCKDYGWKEFGIKRIESGDKEIFVPKGQDPYMRMFLKNYSLRPSCYKCRAKTYRLSDLSIADFWGIDKVSPEMDDNKGISLIIVRSKRGGVLFEKITSKIEYKAVNYEAAVRENSAEYKSVERPVQREEFYRDLHGIGFDGVVKKYFPVSWKRKIKNVILAILKNQYKG